ncbi:unnamed protein product [Somion occarium]|uniref:Fork-head domain-containing protein n=2 Tax=Somion occarium TaxID=3059160 RepID=A0ABP1E3N0_9APHY
MAELPGQRNPSSPISLLLQTLGMTRDDLVRHSTQMRSFLETESNPVRAFSQPKLEPPETSLLDTRSTRSRTHSYSNVSLAVPSFAASPPITPVKTEPIERGLPARQMDTMEMVMERKSKQKKRARKESLSHSREERVESRPAPSTPSRLSRSQNVDTPHHYKYYRERVIGDATPKGEASGSESPSKSRPHYRLPKTPSSRFLDSSRPSSPMSSPAVVNLVSSPGPMRPESEADADELPFTLPPGPYSDSKPDNCYAAIIGQAILSSPQHRLTLQDIYEWITIVYPYYKRGEQTWMNSVRHALSTMAVFRKVPRQRQEGKSLWAIWDCDIPCFANGDFKKSLCADMVKVKSESSKSGPKRRAATDQAGSSRTSKRRRKTFDDADDAVGQPLPPMLPAPILPPFYSSNIVPGTHHQPYYQQQPTYVPQPVPAEVIFPPLPASSSYHHARAASHPLSRPASSVSVDTSEVAPSSPAWSAAPPPSSDSSVPDLTHDVDSSSSPPLSQENLAADDNQEANTTNEPSISAPAVVDPEEEFERWLASDPPSDFLEPGFSLLNTPLSGRKSTSASASRARYAHALDFFQVPDSPTLQRKSARKAQKQPMRQRSPSISPIIRTSYTAPSNPSTPPHRPRTPPRKHSGSALLQLSPHRTPISHRGLHMSPAASLAHYKNNLDPPPPVTAHSQAPLLFSFESESLTLPSPDLLRTPRRRGAQTMGSDSTPSNRNSSIFGPVTPKRLNFNPPGDGSPLRTPSRHLLDPHDPSALLDEELFRLGSQGTSSHTPTGLFGHSRGMLYESPNLPSPGRWDRYW